jgi:hypothetical protein
MRVKVLKNKIINRNCLKIYKYNFQGSKHYLKNIPHQTEINTQIKTLSIHSNSMP